MKTLVRFGVLILALSFSPVSPMVLVLVPLGLMLVALRPGNVMALLVGVLLLVLAFSSRAASPGPDWLAERAWALLLGGGFVAASLLARQASLLSRSLYAVVIGGVGVAAAGLFRPSVLVGLDAWMTERVHTASVALLQWIATVNTQADVAASMTRAITTWEGVQVELYPAFLALASLPALAIGWYIVERMIDRSPGPAPIRGFRFNDNLVWLFAGGLALYALPLGEAAARVGGNAAAFMVAMYVARGGAIFVWILGSAGIAPLTWLMLAVIGALMYPVVLGATFAIGMGDTWLDVRRRLAGVTDSPDSD